MVVWLCCVVCVRLSGKRCEADEKLIARLRECNPTNRETLYIMDARPYKAAVGNTVMGKGFENVNHYDKCQLHFMGIANIHGIRESLDALMELCSSESKTYDDTTWLAKLQETQWLLYLRIILQSGARIAQVLDEEGASVLTHCSDGWDRTAQLVSVAQLLLDPYYRYVSLLPLRSAPRLSGSPALLPHLISFDVVYGVRRSTIEGFAVLIEKGTLCSAFLFLFICCCALNVGAGCAACVGCE
jgi:hypothetical protein